MLTITNKVHILSHVPPGNSECLGAWGREYSRIISRFEDTVAAQFHGHTHYDHFALHYDPANTSRATSVGFISPSVATYTGLSPGYRIYHVDPDTYQVRAPVTILVAMFVLDHHPYVSSCLHLITD